MRSDKYHGGIPSDHLRRPGPTPARPRKRGFFSAIFLPLALAVVAMNLFPASPTAPGAYVTVSSAAPTPGSIPRTGTWFITGLSQMGPVGVAIPLTSMVDVGNYIGNRPSYTTIWDSADEFFHDGGSLAYFSRIVGPSAVAASKILVDRAGSPQNTLTVTANGGGVWGNSCTVAVANGSVSNSYVITLVNTISGQTWISTNLFSPADAVTWATNTAGAAPWAFPFTITNMGSATAAPNNNPAVVAAENLTAGADDNGSIVESGWTAALTAFGSNLGPGQVSAPGHTTAAGYQALNAHCALTDPYGALINNRVALLDDSDTATAASIVTQVGTAQLSPADNGFATMLAPWVIIPGVPATSTGGSPAAATRTVPPSALVAALMAQNDQSNDAGTAVAGPNGTSGFAISVTQTYSETDRGTLNSAGVTVIRAMQSGVQVYGDVTIATNPVWTSLSQARLRMQLVDLLNSAAQAFAFVRIDGQGHALSHLQGTLVGILTPFWQSGALYGASAAQSFQVNVSSVNNPATEAAGQLNAAVSVRMSKSASFVLIGVIAFPITASLPS